MVAFRGIAEGVENSNYALKTTQGDFILTLYEKRVDAADLPWFLGLMEHLAAQGLTCPLPVRARDGRNLNPLAGRIAAITTFLPGVWPRRVRGGALRAAGRGAGAVASGRREFCAAAAERAGAGSLARFITKMSERGG